MQSTNPTSTAILPYRTLDEPPNGKKKASRACKPKTRTGCITCKIRRVKCDEAKPNCLRCTSTGRKCDGYAPIPQPKTRKSSSSPSSSASSSVTSLLRTPPSAEFELFDNDTERRSFTFFKARTIPEIAGFFPSDFWDRLVPLASNHEPALRHAVLALASLHERYEKGDQGIFRSNHDIAEGGFALQQYNKAIRQLILPGKLSKPNLDTSLVACVLFACFESLRGHHGSALSHIDSGVKILTQTYEEERQSKGDFWPSQALCVPRECLDVIFSRLDGQKVQLLSSRPMDLPPPKSTSQPGFNPDIPAAFTSLEEARNNLDYQLNLYHRAAVDYEQYKALLSGDESQEHRDVYDENRTYYRARCERWKDAFQAFLAADVDQMDSKAMQGAMILKLSAHTMCMHLDADAFTILHYQTYWDDLLPMYEEIVDIATVIFDAQQSHQEPDSAGHARQGQQQQYIKPIFQIDHSIIGPLFSVVHRCRDPRLRRRAIALLYRVPRQEGIWNSHLTARCAERIMQIEEAGLGEVRCCADVPDWARISDVEVKFELQKRRGYITYSRLRSFYDTVREPITDVVEW